MIVADCRLPPTAKSGGTGRSADVEMFATIGDDNGDARPVVPPVPAFHEFERSMRTPAIAILAASMLTSAAVALAGDVRRPDAERFTFFEKSIRPVLVKRCYVCHSAKVNPPKGNLRLDTKAGMLKGGDTGPAIVPGKPQDSLLLGALRYKDGLNMPPKGKLPASVVADFERWIRSGAPDPRIAVATIARKTVDYQKGLKFWAFQRPQHSPAPAVANEKWIQRELDRFVLARLEKRGLQPVKPANRYALIRRAYFDLIGLPPKPEEIAAFVNDKSPDAFARVVDRLLKSPHYGERWGRHWLDVARYGEDQAHTFKARKYPRGYRYRDWVVNALNDDMPYDRFLKMQIAGDLIGKQPDRFAALGLFALGPVYYQDNGEKAKALADEWDDRVDTLARGILGLTVSCARCHNHKYDPISMKDYYGLVGIFASSEYAERPIVPDSVVEKKRQADAAINAQQLVIDRFLAAESRNVRAELVGEIPRYVVAAWKVIEQRKSGRRNKRREARLARQEMVSPFLLDRWVKLLDGRSKSANDAWLAEWRTLLKGNGKSQAAVQSFGEKLRDRVTKALPRKAALLAHYGEFVAFANAADTAIVEPGVVPLGNLFDDAKGTSLHTALSTDKFLATASDKSLGVNRVKFGWGKTTQIAPGISFDFQHLGSDTNAYGAITNDGWNTLGGIRTQGKSVSQNARRMEQGIGMHANALITFDLDELRKAGLLPADQTFVFKVDRAGLNDDVLGSGARAHLAVIVAGVQKKNDVYDAIIAGYVNGRKVSVTENDKTYYFNGQIPDPLKADGRFARFEVPIPAKAKYLTLVSTAAARRGEENSISADHAVFSGARLEFDPHQPGRASVRLGRGKPGASARRLIESEKPQTFGPNDKAAAVLLSRMLSDRGLLALPGKEAASRLKGDVAKRLQSLRTELDRRKKSSAAIQIAMAHSLKEGNGHDLHVYLAGNPKNLGETAPRGVPAIFTGGQRKPFDPKGSGRLQLAAAVASKDNPLTARVIVNRVWRGHFGYGLVRTPSNFGRLGERPTHPELLDDLTLKFIASGWSLKWLHREIMLSATYRLSSDYNAGNYKTDPENRLLWRMNRQRLEVEPWRDAMLAVSGRLDATLGGPSSKLSNPNNRRRTLYGFISRHELNDLLRLFDFPDPNITSAKRSVTTVPLQQLFVLNSEFMAAQAKALAARLTKNPKEDDGARIRRAYLLLYGRPATDAEVKIGRSFLKTVANTKRGQRDDLSPWEQYALALLGANEFTFID
jgi:Protein of unknown function (DUF1553)/Protein of unknown function (DUF1549)/Planctomycete cytochrome C